MKLNDDEHVEIDDNSRLDKSKLKEQGFELLPTWQDALKRYLQEIQ